MAESAVQFGDGGSTAGTLNAGSVFGVSQDESNYPLALTEPTPVRGYRQAYEPAPPPQRKMGTVLQGLSMFYHLSASDRQVYTSALVNAGYLTEKEAAKPQSQYNAWRAMVRDAARTGVSIMEQLQSSISLNQSLGGGAGSSGGPTIAQLSDPASVGQTLDDVMTKVLGQRATQKQKDAFLAGIHHAERMQAKTVHDASVTDGSADVVGVDVAARAQDFAQAADPVHADARRVVAAAQVLSNMLKGNA